MTVTIISGNLFDASMLLSADLEQILTPKELVKLAKKIASKWKGVGLELGLESEDIDIIAVDNPTSCEEACKAMLLKWHRRTPKSTLGMLKQAVENYKASSGNYQIKMHHLVFARKFGSNDTAYHRDPIARVYSKLVCSSLFYCT